MKITEEECYVHNVTYSLSFNERNPKGREMFEKANTAYEFLCSRAAKASDAPDADNIVLILRAQSILFSRYSTELVST